MFNPEREIIKNEENKERKVLVNKIKKETFELIKDIVPIDENLRIDIEKYSDIYSQDEIDKDRQRVNKLKSKFEDERESQSRSGEILEILKTYLFNKFMSEKFICVRTSEYDDYFSHIDNVIIDKNNGEVLCAIDNTSDINSKRFSEKKNFVLECNINGGITIKYCLKIDEGKINLAKGEGIPLILIAVPDPFLNKILDSMMSNNPEEFKKNISLFFNGIKTLTEIYIMPKLEEEMSNLENLQRKIKNLSDQREIQIKIDKIESTIKKLNLFKESLT